MEQILLLEKRTGETPLQCMDRFRGDCPEYGDVKMTYAGRLDPMASGLLIVLAGDMVHHKDDFLKLDKTYEATLLIGAATDTFDGLGIVKSGNGSDVGSGTADSRVLFPLERITQELQSFVGTFEQDYPMYSSKTVGGKQLHQIARENAGDIDLPSHLVTVHSISNIAAQEITRNEIAKNLASVIETVSGDFRQLEIVDSWNCFAGQNPDQKLIALSFTISVSSGTYIRAIADEFGRKLGTGACLIKLHRTKIGDFTLSTT